MRLLIADDSKAMRMIILRSLRQSGASIDAVFEAADGAEAQAAIQTFDPTVILCDWDMPKVSGLELLQAVRASGASTVFGFVTAEISVSVREKAIAAGASFVATKPIDGERLGELIGALVT
ncbi:MAG: response regulator receiver protein [Ilumatobacteraceae bacterium]|nr:response regulator receiver protein [Ilumatobacteraceae bacterium]